MKRVQLVWVMPVLLALGGCKSLTGGNACRGTQAYTEAHSVPPLRIPTGLDAPDTTSALRIPALNEPPPPPRRGKDPCLDEPPAFKVRQPTTPPRA